MSDPPSSRNSSNSKKKVSKKSKFDIEMEQERDEPIVKDKVDQSMLTEKKNADNDDVDKTTKKSKIIRSPETLLTSR